MKRKNPHASALGKKGGKARWKDMTPEERSAFMRQAVQARWAKKRKTSRGST